MIALPDFEEQSMYDAETAFHLMLREDRLGKFLAHWEAFKIASTVPGFLVECGVFKGTSFMRFAIMRQLLGGMGSAKLVGFDVFSDDFPDTAFDEDQAQRVHWIATAGGSSIGKDQLEGILQSKGIDNFELVAGDATTTVPAWARENPGARISLLNIDIDFYEPTKTVLEHLFDRVCPGGVVLFDNYSGEGSTGSSYHGDTAPVDEFIQSRGLKIKRFAFASRPAYLVKE